jgi:hypothetical protein
LLHRLEAGVGHNDAPDETPPLLPLLAMLRHHSCHHCAVVAKLLAEIVEPTSWTYIVSSGCKVVAIPEESSPILECTRTYAWP